MTIYKKLQQARTILHTSELTKSGRNTFSKYDYFELGDFLPAIQRICNDVGICGMVSFTKDEATLTMVDVDQPEARIIFTSPMSTAALKGCHEVQNLGAVQTYLRRYLWTAAFEIVEHDALDAATGSDESKTPKKNVAGSAIEKPVSPEADYVHPATTKANEILDKLKSIFLLSDLEVFYKENKDHIDHFPDLLHAKAIKAFTEKKKEINENEAKLQQTQTQNNDKSSMK